MLCLKGLLILSHPNAFVLNVLIDIEHQELEIQVNNWAIVAFHSFLVWIGFGSSLTSQHFACPISLNLGNQYQTQTQTQPCEETVAQQTKSWV